MQDGKAYLILMHGYTGDPMNATITYPTSYNLTIQGTTQPSFPSGPPGYAYTPGWNLVGFTSLSPQLVGVANSTITTASYLGTQINGSGNQVYSTPVYSYDTSSGSWTTLAITDYMTSGLGYWVFFNQADSISPTIPIH